MNFYFGYFFFRRIIDTVRYSDLEGPKFLHLSIFNLEVNREAYRISPFRWLGPVGILSSIGGDDSSGDENCQVMSAWKCLHIPSYRIGIVLKLKLTCRPSTEIIAFMANEEILGLERAARRDLSTRTGCSRDPHLRSAPTRTPRDRPA